MASDTTRSPTDVRREVTAAYQQLQIFVQPRATALYHYLVVVESRFLQAGLATNPAISHFAVNRKVVESSARAIPAIFRLCAPSGGSFGIAPNIFDDAYELFDLSTGLDNAEYCFELADRGQFVVRFEPMENRVIFSYASDDESERDTLLRSSERLEHITDSPSPESIAAMMAAVKEVGRVLGPLIVHTADDAIAYSYTPELTEAMRRWARLLSEAISWQFPETLSFGVRSFSELRRFWGAVLAVSNTHETAHLIVAQGNPNKWPIGSAVHVRTKAEWVDRLTDIAGLSEEAVSQWLSWYTFEPSVSSTSPVLQPFIEIMPQTLAVSGVLLAMASVERNFTRLVAVHPELRRYSTAISEVKEQIALGDLATLFPRPRFQVKQTVVIPGLTDVDLIVYEPSTGFVLAVQHKWFAAPDTLKESASNDERLTEGVHQAQASRDALRDDPELIRVALSLSQAASIKDIEAVVICRGSEPTGFLGSGNIPIITESAFKRLRSTVESLSALWSTILDRPDQSEAADSFEDGELSFSLFEYTFVMPAIATS
jgi:hypothetical protein